MKNILLIGGTGTISFAVVKKLAQDPDWNIWLLNRGHRHEIPEGVHQIIGDIYNEAEIREKIKDLSFDCVCEFIGYQKSDVERDVRLFVGKTKQYVFISTASAYHKPSEYYLVNEGTTLANPYLEYARNKIDCELYLMEQYRENGFPVTIVRPSHTYDERALPVALHGDHGTYQVIARMLQGKPVIIPGDGSSLWTVTFNTDFANGYVGLLANPRAIGETFQITSDETLTWNQIYQTIADVLHVPLHAVHVSSDFLAEAGKPYGYDFQSSLLGDLSVSVVFDNTKLKRTVGTMHTDVPFHIGAELAADYIQSHPECQILDPAFDAWCDKVLSVRSAAVKAMEQM